MLIKVVIIAFCFVHFLQSINAQWEPMEGPYGGYINDLKNNENYQFAATPHGIYRSGDNGDTWHHLVISEGIAYACLQLSIRNDTIITDAVNYENGVVNRYLFRSEDNGNSWTKLNRPEIPYFYVSISFNKSFIYLTDIENLWVSSDQGQSWNYSMINNSIQLVYSLQSFGDRIYVSTTDKFYKSSGSDDHFEEIELDSTFSSIGNFYVFEDLILAQGPSGKLYRSNNGGQSWSSQYIDLSEWVNFVKIHDSYYINTPTTIRKSNDQGIHWTSVPNDLPPFITLMVGAGERILTGSTFYGMNASDDYGISFHTSNYGIAATNVQSLLVRNNLLVSGADYFGITSCDLQSVTWNPSFLLKTPQKTISDIVAFNNSLFSIVGSREIFRSDINGLNWQKKKEALQDDLDKFYFYDQTIGDIYDQSILAGGIVPSGMLSSHYGTQPWATYKITVDGTTYWPYLFLQKENILYAAKPRTIYKSYDKGNTWQPTLSGLDFKDNWAYIQALYSFNDMLLALEFVGYTEARLHVSNDNGDTWQLSSNGLPADSNKQGIISLSFFDNIILACMQDETQGLYVSFDNAQTWKSFNEGLTLGGVQEIDYDSEYLYAGTGGQGVWRRKISDLITTSTHHPVTQQNEISIFPNPSNGNFTLTIDSQLSCKAVLVISDLNGKVCLTKQIVLEAQTEVGTEILSSGLYFLTVQTGDKIYSGKIVIQK